jgi:hypothetical protein
MGDMQNGAILNIGFLADADRHHITPHHSAVPDRRSGSDDHIPDDSSALGHKYL